MHSLISFITRITPESWGVAIYVVATLGLVGLMLGGSYLLAAHGILSLIVGLTGFLLLLGGVVLVLRRRDYRALRSRYADPDSLGSNKEP